MASCHLARLDHDGYPNGSIEARLLLASTVGQAIFEAQIGEFLANPLRFALRCLKTPLDAAIKAEAEIQSGLPS